MWLGVGGKRKAKAMPKAKDNAETQRALRLAEKEGAFDCATRRATIRRGGKTRVVPLGRTLSLNRIPEGEGC
jgi:hypothetical protein